MSESEVSGSDIYMRPSVCFEQGRKYQILAQSGQGKTSLLGFIYGNNLLFDGMIDYHEPVTDLFLLRRDRLSYLFQDLCLFDTLTARENVLIKNRLTDFKSESEIDAMLDTLLPAEKKSQPVATLSLGQRQRVAVVRALCQPFEFLLMDEPFSHIDKQNADAVAHLVIHEVEAQGAGLIVTSLEDNSFFPYDVVLNL